MEGNVEIKRISDIEYCVGENRTKLIHGNVIFVTARGEQTDEIAIEQQKIDKQLSKVAMRSIKYLIDLNNCGKNSPKARATWKRLADDENTLQVALFGMHPVARVVASFVMTVSKKNNQRFFKTKEEALKWLFKENDTGN